MNAILENAAQGILPDWSEVKPTRHAHIQRVAMLVEEWARALVLDGAEQKRWVAAAWLHDALRDARPETLRPLVPEDISDWPGPLLHGPAAAARLRVAGVNDEALLCAVAYHTIGHPDLDALGRAVYLADFLEPGRTFDPIGRAVLRARMPHEQDAVLRQVLRSRMAHLISSHKKIRRETVAFWNSIAA